MPDSPLDRVTALGQSVWIDFLSRELLESGELERMMREDAIRGVTSNPTIFQKAMAEGSRYDAQLERALRLERGHERSSTRLRPRTSATHAT